MVWVRVVRAWKLAVLEREEEDAAFRHRHTVSHFSLPFDPLLSVAFLAGEAPSTYA